MKIGKQYTLPYKRRRQVRTDYRKRLSLIKSEKPRIVVRRMLNNISVQIITYHANGDQTIAATHSRELLKHGWKAHRGNIPSAYLTGLLAGLKAKKAGVTAAVLDIGLAGAIKGSALFAALKGIIDAGISVPHNPEILPSDDRIQGKTIMAYAQNGKPSGTTFSQYKHRGLDITTLPQHIHDVKNKIQQQWK